MYIYTLESDLGVIFKYSISRSPGLVPSFSPLKFSISQPNSQTDDSLASIKLSSSQLLMPFTALKTCDWKTAGPRDSDDELHPG